MYTVFSGSLFEEEVQPVTKKKRLRERKDNSAEDLIFIGFGG